MLTKDEFNVAVKDALPKLRNTVRKIVGHPDQSEELVQETLARAWEHFESFENTSKFSTWLCAIGVNCAKDFLRQQQRWRSKAQIIYADQCINNPEYGMEVGRCFGDPAVEFDTKEHIAYCFSCIGRSIDPIQQAALMLKDVLDLTSTEGAKALGITEPVFRQYLTAARKEMQEKYEGLCSLVNKEGICYQCAGLRDGFPEERKGEWPLENDKTLSFELRINIVREANIDTGKTQIMHEVFWKRTETLEKDQVGDESVEPDCGKGIATEE